MRVTDSGLNPAFLHFSEVTIFLYGYSYVAIPEEAQPHSEEELKLFQDGHSPPSFLLLDNSGMALPPSSIVQVQMIEGRAASSSEGCTL